MNTDTLVTLKKFNVEIAQLYQQGKVREALIVVQQALVSFPNNINLLANAGVFANMINQLDLAKKYYEKVLRLNSKHANTHYNLANLFKEKKQFEKAIKHFKIALKINPNHAESHNNLANLFQNQKKFKKAIKHFQIVLKINPNHAGIHYNLANLFQEQEQFKESIEHYQVALRLNPNHAESHNNLANLFKRKKQFSKAVKHYRAALELNPNHAESHNNLANLFKRKKQFSKAVKHYQTALELNPNYIDAQWNFFLLQLTLGKFNKGWKGYETRNHSENTITSATPPTTPTPQYQGDNLNQDLQGKHLLILPEQGIGDEVMFVSVLPELELIVRQNQNTHITLACEPRLVALFNRSFDFLAAIPKDKNNRYQDLEEDLDYWLFIGSLPKFYRNDIKDFEKHQPYLKTDDMLLSKWQDRFNQLRHSINIGISWTGGKKAEHKRDRSLTLEQLLPVLKQANQNANIINLQYGDHQQEINNFKAQTGIIIHDWEDADPLKDLDNFAAQIKALDLIIGIDNSTVHFSGALGIRTFVMLPFNQDWRWAEDRTDSYWYPNVMTLFRQSQDGEWDDVVQNITNALEQVYSTDKT